MIGSGLMGHVLREIAERIDPAKTDGRRITAWHAPKTTLFERDEAMEEERRNVALSLMDEDTLSFVVVRARRDGTTQACFDLGIAVDDPLWPAMTETLGRIVIEADRVQRAA